MMKLLRLADIVNIVFLKIVRRYNLIVSAGSSNGFFGSLKDYLLRRATMAVKAYT